MKTSIHNSTIIRLHISRGPGGPNPASVGVEVAPVEGIEQDKRYCTLETPIHPGEHARTLGEGILRLFWVLDRWNDLNSIVGMVVRVRLNKDHLTDIGHPILDRWLRNSDAAV